jgi:phage-related protein
VPAISVGSVEVDVIPNTQGIYNRLRGALVPAATRAGQDAGNAAGRAFGPALQRQVGNVGLQIGQRIGQQIASRITAALRTSVRNGITQAGQAARPAATRQGEETGGAFARSLRAKLTEAFRSMPKLDVKLGDTGVDADLARLRAKLESLSNKTIGVDIDAETARAQAADIEERLRRLGAAHPNVTVRADTARAIASLQALQAQIDEVTADPARVRVETDGTFGQRLRAQVQAAEASLPNINLRADSSDVDVEIARLRAQLTALRDVRIGVDMDTATARARIEAIQARLQRLSASDADVAVRVDAAAAAAQLAAMQTLVNRLDGQTATVNVRVSGMQLLVTAALALGPALIPVLPVIAAGLGAITSAAVAAAAGLGAVGLVAIPAFKQIGGVLQAQKAAQDAATAATNQGGQASSQAASKAMQMAGAQQSLASAQRNASRQIVDAQRAVGDAVRQAAQANAQAAAQVKQARTGLADAYAQAADRMRQANQQVAQAERDLVQAQKNSRQAQLDLTAARAEASRQLQDMNNQLTDSKLSERDAEIALTEATARRNAVLDNANASELDKQKALLAYDQAVQRLNEQRLETKRLTTDTAKANKAGVEGSQAVKSAQEQLASAQQDVVDKTAALKTAQQDVTKTQVANTRAIAEAQNKLAEAQKNVSETQRQGAENIARAQERVVQAQESGADSIASAQRAIQSASMGAAGGVDQAAIAQAKYRAELAKLTPAARDTMNAYLDLRTAFGAWSKSLQPDVMPIFTRGLGSLRKTLPSLTPFVKGAADAIKELQDRASKSVKSPFWQGFKKDLQGSVKPAIVGLGVAIGNLIKGMAGIFDAFLPHMDGISSRMQKITKRFADWGAGLKGSPEFERFLTFASEKATLLGAALRKIGSAFLQVGEALAPFSGPLLMVLGGIANAISIVADKAPWLVQGIYAIIVAVRLWTIAQWAWNAAQNANPWQLIIVGIVLLVAAIVYAYNKFGWFRAAVDAVWSALKTGGKAVVDWFTGPFKNFFTKTIPGIFQFTLDWVKRNWPWILGALGGPIGLAVVAIIKHWDDIKRGLSSAWSAIKRTTLYPIRDFFTKTIPGWGNTLRDRMVEAFDGARKGIKTAWDKIKGIAKAPVQYVVDVVYNNGIRGVWNMIAGAFGAPKLKRFEFASGGIMPGYTPGKDVHQFVSPTGGMLELSGGEAIMRPEFTRAVGSGFINTLNSIASSRGAQGVKAALAPVFGGSAPMSTDRSSQYARGGVVQSFADGGVFGWIKSAGSALKGAGSDAWNAIKKGASWLADTLEASARAGVKHVVDPLLARFPGMDTGIGKMIRHIPNKIIDALFGYSKQADDKGAGGIGGPRIAAGLKWAKTQAGKPYQWAGNGNPSWDCSGFMSAIESVIRGQKPHRRWATGAFSGKTAPPGWVYHGNSPFKIGITNAGVGHTAGTIAKTNVESRGGAGVVVGSRARGYNDRLFGSWYGFKPGTYDAGGYIPPGLNLVHNGTGRPEPVFTTAQANALTSMANRSASQQLGDLSLNVWVGNEGIASIARAEVHNAQGELIQVLNAS